MIFATTALVAAACMVAMGVVILWANPRRGVNRAVFGCAMNIVAWLVFWHLAVAAPYGTGLLWVRWTTSIGAFVALSYWLVKEVGLAPNDLFSWTWCRRHWPWLILPGLLAIVPFTNSFIPANSAPDHRVYGFGYYGYIVGSFVLYFMLATEAAALRRLADERRVELQLWITGGAVMFIMIETLMVLSIVTRNNLYRHLEPIVILFLYGGVSYAVTAHRVFDARHVMLVVLQKAALAATVLAFALPTFVAVRHVVSPTWAIACVAIVSTTVALVSHRLLDRTFHFYPGAQKVREAVIAAALNETATDVLRIEFENVLRGWAHSDHAVFLCVPRSSAGSSHLTQGPDDVAIHALRRLHWVTHERLIRERASADHDALQPFMAVNRIAAAVIAEGPAMTAIAAVGVQASRRPYTFPQITQLLELASIMEARSSARIFRRRHGKRSNSRPWGCLARRWPMKFGTRSWRSAVSWRCCRRNTTTRPFAKSSSD